MNYPDLVVNLGSNPEVSPPRDQGYAQSTSQPPNLPLQNVLNQSFSNTVREAVQNSVLWDQGVTETPFNGLQHNRFNSSTKPTSDTVHTPQNLNTEIETQSNRSVGVLLQQQNSSHTNPQKSVHFTGLPNMEKNLPSDHKHSTVYQDSNTVRMGQNHLMKSPIDSRYNLHHNIQTWPQSSGQSWHGGTVVNPVQYHCSPQQEQHHQNPNYHVNNLQLQEYTRVERPAHALMEKILLMPKSSWNYQYWVFNKATNFVFSDVPTLLGRPLDLYNLFYAIINLGGFQRVCADDGWQLISENIGLGHVKEVPNSLRNIYQQYLLRFENYLTKTIENNLVSNNANIITNQQHPNYSPYNSAQLQSVLPRSESAQPAQVAPSSQVRIHRSNIDAAHRPRIIQQNMAQNRLKPNITYQDMLNAQQLIKPIVIYPDIHYQQQPVNQTIQYVKPLKMQPVHQPSLQNAAPSYPQPTYASHLQIQPHPVSSNQYQRLYPAPIAPDPSIKTRQQTTPSNIQILPNVARKKPPTLQPQTFKHATTVKLEKHQSPKKNSQKAAFKEQDIIFNPLIYNVQTYGGLDISALASIPPAPPINMNLFQGPIDVNRIIMSFKSKLDSEIKHALDTLFVISLNISSEFSFSEFYEIFDLMLLVTEGKLSDIDDKNGYSSIQPEVRHLFEEFDEDYDDDCQDELPFTASSTLLGDDHEKRGTNKIKKFKSHKKASPKSVRLVLQSYRGLIQLQKLTINGVQDIRSSIYEVICGENRKLRVFSVETILLNFSFFPKNQKIFSQSRRFCRLLMSMLTSGALFYNIHPLDPGKSYSNLHRVGNIQDDTSKNSSKDRFIDAKSYFDLGGEKNSLTPEVVTISDKKQYFKLFPDNTNITIERRVNGLTILSNIAFHYRIQSDFEASIIWNIIFDFLTTDDPQQSYVALNALTKLILIYENATYLIKIEKIGLLIQRVLSFLPSERYLELRDVQLTEKESLPDNHHQSHYTPEIKQSLNNKNCIILQPTLANTTPEDMSIWEMASMALLHIIQIEGIQISNVLSSIPRFTFKLINLIKMPHLLSNYGVPISLMPLAYSLSIRSLKTLLNCLKDGAFCKLAGIHEQNLFKILWSLQSMPEYFSHHDNHNDSPSLAEDHYQYSTDAFSLIKYIESLLIECLSLIGHKN